MNRLLPGLILLFYCFIPFNATSSETTQQDLLQLDGNSFSGSISAKGIYGLVSVKGSLIFKGGYLIWQTDPKDNEYLPAVYKTTSENNKVKFSAIMLAKNNKDVVTWQGYYDGKQLENVTAEWVREKGDLVHDLLLPDKMVMLFKPHKKQK